MSRIRETATHRLELVDRIAGYPNPFETYLLVAGVAQGLAMAVGIGRSPALAAALGGLGWLRWVWAALMVFGGVTALVGLYWPGDPFTAVEVKRAGLISTGFGALIYAVALWAFGRTGILTGCWAAALTLACIMRTVQVSKLLRRAEQAVERERAG